MPALRTQKQSLRERRNVQLKVNTAAAFYEDQSSHQHNKDDLNERGRSRYRHGVTKKQVGSTNTSSLDEEEEDMYARLLLTNPNEGTGGGGLGRGELESLHELLPNFFIAFSDGEYSVSSLQAMYGINVTHIIKIVYPRTGMDNKTKKHGNVAININPKTGVHTLILTIPNNSLYHSGGGGGGRRSRPGRRHVRSLNQLRMTTLLCENQLLAARDFLSLVLPFYLQARPTTRAVTSSDRMTLVLSSPEGTAVDVMAVVACYLSFVSERDVETVLDCIEDEEGLGDEWRDVVSREDEGGVEFIQRVALM